MKIEDIEKIVKYDGQDRIVHFTDYLIQKASKGELKRYHSEFSFFDKAINGLETGEVIVVSGNTKMGKTTFAESWLYSIKKTDPFFKYAIFSFEVQTEKMLLKYQKSDLGTPLYVPLELKAMDYDWLYSKCAEAKYKYNCNAILIDHLHFIIDMNTKQNMSLNIGAFMRRLKKDIAIDLNLCVILIAHQGQPDQKQEASISNLRDSSFVGQESDSTIIVARRKNFDEIEIKQYENQMNKRISEYLEHNFDDSDYSQGLTIVKVAVHRRTGVFEWKKLFIKRGDFLEEL